METVSTEVTSIQRRSDIEKSTWKTHWYFVDFESRIHVEISTLNRCHTFHVDSPFKIDEISTNFPHGIMTSYRWRIDEDVSIGIKHNLMIEKDENGLYRSMGRLSNANLNFNTKFPILLHNDHYLTELIVKDNHEKVSHNGFKHTLSEQRQNYWIVIGRNHIKKILWNCVICKKFNARCYRYRSSSNLPKSRGNQGNPFGSIGVNYFGPLYNKASKQFLFYVTTNDKTEMFKCNVILYTCTITRAIILDLVKDSYTKTFINSLRTFIAWRGCPKNVIVDNRKVFTADETQAFCLNKGISWASI